MTGARRKRREAVPAIILLALAQSFCFFACDRSNPVSSGADASLDGSTSPDASPPQSTFYVAPGGSDDWSGDFEHPFATLARAQQAVRGALRVVRGDVVIVLRGGVHQLAAPLVLGPEDSGSAAGAVVFRAWQDERPVISGGQSIGGWQPAAGMPGTWTATTGAVRSRQLFVNGARAVRATGRSPVALSQVPDGYDAADATLAAWRHPAELELIWELGAGPWASPRCPVRSVNNTHIAVAEPCWHNTSQRAATGVPSISGPPTRIENAIELLDEPGEFYLDQTAGAVYYRPRPTDDMQTATAVVPVLESLLIIGDGAAGPAHDIRFEGIQFSHTTWLGPASDDGFAEAQANFHMTGPGTPPGSYNQGGCDRMPPSQGSCPFGAWAKVPGAVIVTRAQSIRFERDVFAHLGGAGLDVERGSSDVTVEGCVFTDTSANAIQVGDVDIEDPASPDVTHDVTLSNNWIHHTPVEYLGGVGVFVGHTRDVTVDHSRIDHTPYSGLSAGWGWADISYSRSLGNPARRTKILFNRIFAHNLVNQDGDAIYLNSVQGTSYDDGALVEGNALYDGTTIDGGLYTDNGSRFLTLRGNVVNQWIGCRPIGDMIFDDNDVLLVGVPQFGCLLPGAPPPPVTLSNNRIITGLDKVAPERIARAGLTAAFADLLTVSPL